MKFLVYYILFSLLHLSSQAQTDTIKIFNHLKMFDRWQLKMSGKNSFALTSNNLFSEDEIITKGTYKLTDTTISFICDTSKLKDKDLVKESLKKFSNIPFIVNGNAFVKSHNYFVPLNINYSRHDTLKTPKEIYARYYRGDGFGSSIIQLNVDMTYTIEDNSCMVNFEQEGTWILHDDQITFIPKYKANSMLDNLTQNNKMFVSDEYLIGKKVTKTYTKTKKTIVTETYFYLSKQPDYSKRQNTAANKSIAASGADIAQHQQ